VVWDPVWTTDRLSPSARDKLSMPMEELLPYRERRLAHARRGPAAAESGRDRGGLLTAREGG
jgi:metal-sulfur cluster biosynthetic enzyme